MPIQQPSGQIKLTNVAVVRLKKGGQRFEIACYKNKVQEWRTGVETDMSEVLQIERVFTNVGKGKTASTEELKKSFGDGFEESKVIDEILKKGDLQVGEKERQHGLEDQRKEIATIVAEKCVDPDTNRPHTVSMIEKAMAEVHFNANPKKNSKSQALDLIRQLQESKVIPIARAQMRVRLTLSAKEGKKVKEQVMEMVSNVEEDDWSDEWELIALIDPGNFRAMSDLAQSSKGRVETLSFAAVEGDVGIE